jgi:hypothetical protein
MERRNPSKAYLTEIKRFNLNLGRERRKNETAKNEG